MADTENARPRKVEKVFFNAKGETAPRVEGIEKPVGLRHTYPDGGVFEVVVGDFPKSIRDLLALRGANDKFNDKATSPASKEDWQTCRLQQEALKKIMLEGTFSERGTGGGGGGDPITLKAIARMKGWTLQEASDKADKVAAQHNMKRAALLNQWRQMPDVKKVILEIENEELANATSSPTPDVGLDALDAA